MASFSSLPAIVTFTSILLLPLVTDVAPVTAQSSPLRIVVIEGENAVNIIQQKTAVRPVVEVRDQNDLPVSGATVTFTITGGKTATFAGAQSVSVTTNAAGRAAVSALNPIGNGAVRIQVQAAFQGQTATTAIAQTNFMTAAQAAQAAGPSSSGAASGGSGASGGGGGWSALAITGIVAGAGGTFVALKLAGQSEDSGEASTSCRLDFVNPFTMPVPAGGGSFTATFATTCMLSVTSDQPWIIVTSPPTVPANSTFTVAFTVAPNTTGAIRMGTIAFARGATDRGGGFTVAQLA